MTALDLDALEAACAKFERELDVLDAAPALIARVRALEAALGDAIDLACPHNDAERLQLATLRSVLTSPEPS